MLYNKERVCLTKIGKSKKKILLRYITLDFRNNLILPLAAVLFPS